MGHTAGPEPRGVPHQPTTLSESRSHFTSVFVARVRVYPLCRGGHFVRLGTPSCLPSKRGYGTNQQPEFARHLGGVHEEEIGERKHSARPLYRTPARRLFYDWFNDDLDDDDSSLAIPAYAPVANGGKHR